MTLSITAEEPHTYATTFAKHAAFTVFPEGKVGRSPQLKKREERNSDGPSSEDARSETFTQRHWVRHTRATENLTVMTQRKPDPNLSQRMNNLKATLKRAYKSVGIANKRSHQTNKEYYDRRAKPRSFEVGEYVYVFNPARKPGLSKKFFKSWAGPFKVTTKISDLNYEVLGKNDRKQVVHINRLKPARGYHVQNVRPRPPRKHKARRDSVSSHSSSEELSAIKTGALPLATNVPRQDNEPPIRRLLIGTRPYFPRYAHWYQQRGRTHPTNQLTHRGHGENYEVREKISR